jgi:hypothetical protein
MRHLDSTVSASKIALRHRNDTTGAVLPLVARRLSIPCPGGIECLQAVRDVRTGVMNRPPRGLEPQFAQFLDGIRFDGSGATVAIQPEVKGPAPHIT